jgi:hypothetical protein
MASMYKLTTSTGASFEVKDTAGVCSIELDGVGIPDAAEIAVLDGVTAGTVTASKAVVVDSNKDIGDFRNLDVVNLDAGSSGVAGTVDIFPTTAAKGKTQFTATDNTGDTTTTVTTAAQATTRTYTIPDAGANASFVMTEGAQTLTGVKTFASGVAFGAAATLDVDSANVSATGNDTTQTATVTKMAGTITTGALTTAANATTAVVLTLTGVAAGDKVLVTMAGGTNTTAVYCQSAIATTNTITVVLRNGVNATTALDGTVAFHYLWMKA